MPRWLKRRPFFALSICFLSALILYVLLLDRQNIPRTNQDDKRRAGERDYVLDTASILGSVFWPKGAVRSKSQNKQNGTKNVVQIFQRSMDIGTDLKYEKVKLKTTKGEVPLYVYTSELDTMISSRVRDFGTWEEDLLEQTAKLLLKYKDITFIDLGCNIGVYTMSIAVLGADVIAVDAVPDNLQLLSMSLSSWRFHSNVTLVWNAISNKYKQVKIEIPSGNIGGAHVVEKKEDSVKNLVPTILVDDLIPLVKTRNIAIKMDIEGHEVNALQGAKTFFQTFDVKFILMEFMHHRSQDSGHTIENFLVRNGFMPYGNVADGKILNLQNFYNWPENVFWIKR